jgi:eukaryotic-like serine/threonine-protein kinase
LSPPRSDAVASSPSAVAEYVLGERLAAGGWGTVHLGLKLGALGFRRLVAIKRLHPHLADDAEFVARFKEEIRLVSRFTHPNIVQTFDVVESPQELALIMEFADGVTLQELLVDAREAGVGVPPAVTVGILCQVLHGLHAAHEATDDRGRPLQIVHRDVSPQNVIVGKDGLVKVLDFGIAKAIDGSHVTRTGQLSGKVAYMAPEQVLLRALDRRTDVFAAGIVLWEALTGERLFRLPGTPESAALTNILELRVRPPSAVRRETSVELDRIVLRALERDPARRFGSARDFALALEDAMLVASASDIAGTTSRLCAARIERRADGLQRFWQAVGSVEATRRVALVEVAMTPALSGRQLVGATTSLFEPTASDLFTAPMQVLGGDSGPQHSEVQGVLLAGALPRVQPARRRYLGKALGLAAGIAALWFGAHGVLGRFDGPARADSRAQPVAEPAPPLPAALTASVFARVAPPARAAESVEVSVDAQRSDRTPPSRAQGAQKRRVAPPASRRARPAPEKQAAATDACSPPTYTDAEGIRHFKRDCL